MVEIARQVQLQALTAEKESLQSLYKKWSLLISDERKEVRRIFANTPEFTNRQYYLNFKRAFGSYVERER